MRVALKPRLALSRLMLEARAQFLAASCTCSPMILLAILCWLIREFLVGCAAHLRGMYMAPLSQRTTRMLEAPYRLLHHPERSLKARGPKCASLQAVQCSENPKRRKKGVMTRSDSDEKRIQAGPA
jgi:hypothetical protein